MHSPPGLSESYPAVAASVPLGRHALAGFARRAGASDEQIDGVRLAASEAITNVVRHAYGEGGGSVHVTAAVTSDELWVLIADDGNGLRARSDTGGLGMGLALIACVADTFAVVKRSFGGIELQMRFGLHGRKSPQPDHGRGSVSCATTPA